MATANATTPAATADAPSLNPCLRPFWQAATINGVPIRNRVLHGGRASSKSWDAAGFATFLTNSYRLRVLCVRQFQNKISESVYALLKIQIARFGLKSRYRIDRNKIYNRFTGSEFMFYGLYRSIDEIKSMEDIDILWIEEAHNLTKEQWKILEPTIRKQGSQIWVIFNPKIATDFAYKLFVLNPPPGTIVRRINFDENPFLSDTMRAVIENARKGDPEDFAHVYLGEPRANDEDAVIKRTWILAAIDAHKKLGITPTGAKRIGFDVADSGTDKCAEVYAHGALVSWADLWKGGEDELLKSCTRVWNEGRKRGASVTYDSIGVGATAGAKFAELNKANPGTPVLYAKFNAGGAVFQPEALYSNQTKNQDQFANIKAQAWWLVADRFRNTYNAVHNGQQFREDELIFIASECPYLDQIIDELSTPKRDFDNNGKVKVESKKDLAKREIESPNLGDAFVMAFAPGVRPLNIQQGAIDQILNIRK